MSKSGRSRSFLHLAVASCLYFGAVQVATATVVDSLVPNLCTRACNLETYGHEYLESQVLFRFDNAIANKGDFQLEIHSGSPFGPHPGAPWSDDDSAYAIQWWKIEYTPIFDGPITYKYVKDTVGVLVYHTASGHSHWHYEGFARYRLFEVAGGSGVGDLVLEGGKVGFCLIDGGELHDPDVCGCGPILGEDTTIHFTPASCSSSPPNLIEGISVTRFDLYGLQLDGQTLDVTEVTNGVYWLESTVDPSDSLVEVSQSDNSSMIKVQIISSKDTYEVNDSKASVDAMPLKPPGQGSANLAACSYPIVIADLSIHQELEGDEHDEIDPDEDWFRFRMNATGGTGQYVRIEFDQSLSDLVLELRNSADSVVASSDSNLYDKEEIPLANRSSGWYYVRVFPREKDEPRNLGLYHIMYNYYLTINAPGPICGDITGDGAVNSADVVALSPDPRVTVEFS